MSIPTPLFDAACRSMSCICVASSRPTYRLTPHPLVRPFALTNVTCLPCHLRPSPPNPARPLCLPPLSRTRASSRHAPLRHTSKHILQLCRQRLLTDLYIFKILNPESETSTGTGRTSRTSASHPATPRLSSSSVHSHHTKSSNKPHGPLP